MVTNTPKVVANKVRIRSGLTTEFYEHSLSSATKLGQGNVFTGVCDSVNMGGVCSQGGLLRRVCSRGVCSRGEGGWVCSGKSVFAPGGVSAPRGGGVESPPGRLLLRAVSILLECILVICMQAIQAPNGKEKLLAMELYNQLFVLFFVVEYGKPVLFGKI